MKNLSLLLLLLGTSVISTQLFSVVDPVMGEDEGSEVADSEEDEGETEETA